VEEQQPVFDDLFDYGRKDRNCSISFLEKVTHMTEKPDRRVQRTRKLLLETLIALMIEKGYENITVQHIIDHANVGRSTFYAHFMDKQDLLQSGINQLKAQLLIHQKEAPKNEARSSAPEFRFAFTLAMFHHAEEHYALYRALVGRESGAMVQLLMKQMFTELFQQEHDSARQQLEPIVHDLVIQYAVSSLLSLMTWWLDQRMPISVEDMDDIFHTLTAPGITAMLNRTKA
jgi:AcrR family transcriptional regulator